MYVFEICVLGWDRLGTLLRSLPWAAAPLRPREVRARERVEGGAGVGGGEEDEGGLK